MKVNKCDYVRVWWLSGVHLVDTNDQLLDTQGEGQESVLTGLTILEDTGFKLTDTSSDDQDSTIGLGGASDHVLDEITVTGGVDDGDVVPLCKSGGTTTLFLSIKTKTIVGLAFCLRHSLLRGRPRFLEKVIVKI